MDIERPILMEEWYRFYYRAHSDSGREKTFYSGSNFCQIEYQTMMGSTKVDVTRNSRFYLLFDNGDRLLLAKRPGTRRTFAARDPRVLVFGSVEAMMLAIITKGYDAQWCLAKDRNCIVWKGHKFIGRINNLPSKYSSYFRKGVSGTTIRLDRLGVIKRTKQVADNPEEKQFWTLI